MSRARLVEVLILVALLSAVAGYVVRVWWERPGIESAATDTEHLPSFSLPDIDGQMHSQGDWTGKILFINFWATWCPPCLREIPAFIALQEQYGKQGVQFLGVAIDERDEVADFMDSIGINYTVLVGAEDAIALGVQLGNTLGVLPFTAVVDRTGRVVATQQGELPPERAEQLIKELL